MLRVVNLEEFHRLLLQVPGIADDLERGSADGARTVRQWLVTVEAALENNRKPLAGTIASLRARLDAAMRGVIPPNVAFTGRPTRRKVSTATAAAVLEEATTAVSNEVADDEVRFDEADRIARQLVVAAQLKGMVGDPPKKAQWDAAVQAIWSAIAADPELSGGAAHLLSLVGPHDAVVVLDRALTRDAWS